MWFVVTLLLLPLFVVSDSGNRDMFGIISSLDDDQWIDELDDLDLQWVRVTLYWNRIEATPDRFMWKEADRQIRRAISGRLNVFITLEGTPGWANGGKGPEYPPRNPEDFADFAHQVAERYGRVPEVSAIGMWNEPNLVRFWKGSRKEYQEKILAPGSRAVKSAASRLLVAAPEMSHHWKKQSQWQLKDLLDTPHAVIDIITQHYYPDADVPLDVFLEETVDPQRKDKFVWISEIGEKGSPGDSCSLDRQAHFYASIPSRSTERFSWIQRVFVYRLWDPDPLPPKEDPFAVTYGKPLQRKPAFDTLRDMIAGRPFREPFPECHQ